MTESDSAYKLQATNTIADCPNTKICSVYLRYLFACEPQIGAADQRNQAFERYCNSMPPSHLNHLEIPSPTRVDLRAHNHSEGVDLIQDSLAVRSVDLRARSIRSFNLKACILAMQESQHG